MQIPRSQINWIVGRFHVSTSDVDIKSEIRKRCVRGWTEKDIVRAEIYAVKCHHGNQRLYGAVVSGRFNRA